MRRRWLAALPLIAASVASAQRGGGAPQQAPFNTSSNPLLSSFAFRSIGPASMGGRIDDIEVALTDPNIIYVGYAVGGVWKSVNHGVSFEPVFQSAVTASIGDIAIHPTNPDIVYVGTGEANNRQTNSFGDGVYKTTDGGKTWTNVGLRETQSIGRILIDPKNPETVYVAAEGHLFGPNKERGIYKSTNGGKSWDLVKFIDENTGFSDIAMDPQNSNVLYAGSYQRRRTSCCFNGGGPGGGLWKSDDAGKTWKKLDVGVPSDLTIGRVAVAVAPSNPNVVYAQLQVGQTGTPDAGRGRGGRGGAGGGGGAINQPTLGDTAGRGGAGAGRGGFGGGGGRGAGQLDYTAYSGGDAGNVNACRMPEPANAYPNGLHADAVLRSPDFKIPTPDPKQGGVYRSNDKGAHWTLVSNCNSRPMYFSQLRIDPTNPDILYVSDLPVDKSVDGGKTFFVLGGGGGANFAGGHVDQHARWIDPKNGNHLLVGNDGGFQESWDQGRTWDYHNTMATGLAYQVSADMRRPYHVYTGLQDNGSWGGPSSTRTNGIYNSDWYGMCGGDGFYTAVNPDKPWIAYCESQDGGTQRYNFKEGTQSSIRPTNGGGGRGGRGGGGGGGRGNVLNAQQGDQYRFNWNTPYMLSPHDANIVWYGGNHLFKSYNGGDTWVASPDLTKQIDRTKVTVMGVQGDKTMLAKNDGHTAYSTIITVSESPVMPGVVWAGTDDGNLQVSRDGGTTFTEVGKNLPNLPKTDDANLYWISRVEASHFDAATAYVAVDGHRLDDLRPHVYKTTDYGATFKDVSGDLPQFGNVQVVREGAAPGPNGAERNRDLLFVGTEFGLYVSLNGGQHWEPFMNDYPTVRTDDILVHPRDGDLIVATHGRSVMIADDITPLQQLTPTVQSSDAYLFEVRPAVNYLRDVTANQHTGGQRGWEAPNAPRGTAISYYLKAPATSITLTVTGPSGPNGATVTQNLTAPNRAGVNRVQFGGGGGGGRGGGGGGGGFAGGQVTINGQTVDIASLTPAQQDSLRQAFAQGGGGFGGGGGRGGGGGLQPGTYTAKLTVNGKDYVRVFDVLDDKWAFDTWAIDR
ncbi:MAG TPA: hypothetical protein VIV65_07480 [Gemmatimonadaceae bacterium]